MKHALVLSVAVLALAAAAVAQAAEDRLARAYVDVSTGARRSADVGSIHVARARAGGVTIVDRRHKVAGSRLSGDALAGRIKAKLDGDDRLHTKDLGVKVVGGMPVVTGVVHGPDIGVFVVEDALAAGNTGAVRARLLWPAFLNVQPKARTSASRRHHRG